MTEEERRKKHDEEMDEFIKRINPYKPAKQPFGFDLRGYSRFLNENNITDRDEQLKVAEKFKY